MNNERVWFSRLGLVVALAAASGCGPAPQEPDSAPVEGIQQPVITGNWTFNLWDGATGENPALVTNLCPGRVPCDLAVCAVQVSGRWHSGKLWENQCRFEWNNQFKTSRNYAVLQHPTEGTLVLQPNTGSVPDNAVITPHGTLGGLPVCASWQAVGKVFNGTCRWEYHNSISTDFVFEYVVLR